MSRPSWVESPVFESPDEHSTSGVRLADELVPPPMGDELAPPSARATTLPPEPAASDEAPVSGVMRVAAARPADPYDRHLDDVVRAFFPGWGPRSPRASRAPSLSAPPAPPAPPARKHG